MRAMNSIAHFVNDMVKVCSLDFSGLNSIRSTNFSRTVVLRLKWIDRKLDLHVSVTRLDTPVVDHASMIDQYKEINMLIFIYLCHIHVDNFMHSHGG